MSKKSGKLARRYAQALLTAARKEGISDNKELLALATTVQTVASYYESDANLQGALLSPAFPKAERERALHAVCTSLQLPQIATRAIELLFQRDRLSQLPQIAATFVELANREAGIVEVQISTPQALGADEQQRIAKSLAQLIGGTPVFNWHVAPELLGGMVVRYGGKVIDGSVAGKLGRLQNELMR